MATGATEFMDVTTAAFAIPEIWAREGVLARNQQLVFAEMVNRVWENDVSFGDTVHVPQRTHLSARTKNTSSNAAITYETQTETNIDITIGTWEYSAIALETATAVQSNRDLLEFYAPEMGYALALAVDDVLAGLGDDFSNTAGVLGTPVTYDSVLGARQSLRDANAPSGDTWIAISPAQEAEFMKLDQFINSDYGVLQGDINNGIREAYIGSWMKMPVFVTTNIEGSNAAGHDNGMWQREAMALVMQMRPRTHTMFDIDYLADKAATEQLYGSREMRDDHGYFLPGK